MTKRELINALEDDSVADDETVLFSFTPDDDASYSCLVADLVSFETAHDDDCTPFFCIYLEEKEGNGGGASGTD
jgi:hypothetical protein